VLIAGIDEDSARRITAALKGVKIVDKLDRAPSKTASLWNAGLLVSGFAGLLAIGSGLIGAIVLGLIAMAAPVVGAYFKLRKLAPLTREPMAPHRAEKWLQISEDYGPVMAALDGEPALELKSIASTVMDIEARLAKRSIVARAAGEDSGRLFRRMEDGLRAAIEICRRIPKEKRKNATHYFKSSKPSTISSIKPVNGTDGSKRKASRNPPPSRKSLTKSRKYRSYCG
jgi:hypothetical protein